MPKVVEQKAEAPRKAGKIRIGSASQEKDGGIKAIFYGGTGTGRTTCAATFPKPLLIIRPEAVEDGIKSVRNVAGVDVTEPLSEDVQLLDVIEMQQKEKRYKTLVLDSTTLYQDLVLKRVLGMKEVPTGFTWAMATQSEWGTIGIELKERLRELLKLAKDGTNIIFTGAERLINDKEGSQIMQPQMVIALTPATVGWLNVVCNCVLPFRKLRTFKEVTKKVGGKDLVTKEEKTSYVAMTGPDEFWTTKLTRTNGREVPLPQYLEDPDYSKIAKLIG